MKITIHATQRFLERVMLKKTYTCLDIDFAMRFLEKTLMDVVPAGSTISFALPSFENYKVIYKEGSVITIVPKGEHYAS